HPFDPEVLTSDASDQDVRVVPARHRGHGVSMLDACPDQDAAVEPDTRDGLAGEPGSESNECLRSSIDDGHRMTTLDQTECERGPDSPTSDDDDMHGSSLRHGRAIVGTWCSRLPGHYREEVVKELATVSQNNEHCRPHG